MTKTTYFLILFFVFKIFGLSAQENYKVAYSDTMINIGFRNGINVDSVFKLNDKADFQIIYFRYGVDRSVVHYVEISNKIFIRDLLDQKKYKQIKKGTKFNIDLNYDSISTVWIDFEERKRISEGSSKLIICTNKNTIIVVDLIFSNIEDILLHNQDCPICSTEFWKFFFITCSKL